MRGAEQAQLFAPPGAIDAHCHVFGPGAEFPYAPERKYTPCDASKAQLFALRDHLGFDRNVIVQATCHGADNSAMVDALLSSNGRARGIATVRRDVTDAELKRLHQAGVRGVRFDFVQAAGRLHAAGRAQRDRRTHYRARLAYRRLVRGCGLGRALDFLSGLPTTIVVDHMGRPDVTKPVDGPNTTAFSNSWTITRTSRCKVTCPERLSGFRSPRAQRREERLSRCRSFARKVVEEFPGRVLWGTDWPRPTSRTTCPTTD